MGPPNFYNSRGLCNICHKSLRHRFGPLWDTAWEQRSWSGTPTGTAGVVANGACDPRCQKLRSHACSCGGPGGTGLPRTEWQDRLGGRLTSYLLEGALVPSLDAWENTPPELTTGIRTLLNRPEAWLADQIGKGAVARLLPQHRAKEAARVATSLLYRWWRSGPGVPGPGTAFVAKGDRVVCVYVDPATVVPLELWGARPKIEELVWDQLAGGEDDPAPLDRPDSFVPVVMPSRTIRKHPGETLCDLAVLADLPAPAVRVLDKTWEVGWLVGDDFLAIFGEVGHETVTVTWSYGTGVSSHEASLAASPWPAFFAAARGRR